MTITDASTQLLADDMLERFDERAPIYDRDNRFFGEDFDELRAGGYLDAALPTDLGGAGLNLPQVNRLQRRLAYRAPATALGVNMHLYWVGAAADLRRMAAPAATGSCRPRRTARSWRPVTARRATTSLSSLRRPGPSGSTAAGRSPATRSSAA